MTKWRFPLSLCFSISGKLQIEPFIFVLIIKPDINSLLAATNINNSIVELDNYVAKLCEWGNHLDKLSEVWEELDQKFFAYAHNLNALNINYISQNKNAF